MKDKAYKIIFSLLIIYFPYLGYYIYNYEPLPIELDEHYKIAEKYFYELRKFHFYMDNSDITTPKELDKNFTYDCDDFAIWMGDKLNKHGIPTIMILMEVPKRTFKHVILIYKTKSGYWTWLDNYEMGKHLEKDWKTLPALSFGDEHKYYILNDGIKFITIDYLKTWIYGRNDPNESLVKKDWMISKYPMDKENEK